MNVAPLYCGIDVGKGGAVAFYAPSNPKAISVYDMPVVDAVVDGAALAALLRTHDPDAVFIERAAARPGQGVSGVFSFGHSAGIVAGVVAALGLPSYLVTPQAWKKHYGLSGKDKEASRAKAVALWPASDHFRRVCDHGRAEAALIARYGAETIVSVSASQRAGGAPW